jgi:hypothetical protein
MSIDVAVEHKRLAAHFARYRHVVSCTMDVGWGEMVHQLKPRTDRAETPRHAETRDKTANAECFTRRSWGVTGRDE